MRVLFLAVLAAASSFAQSFSAAESLDQAIDQAIKEGRIPGAVLLIGHRGQIIHRKAYGHRALEPVEELMTADTIFDCASLTKIVATTSAMMKLFETGKVRLLDPVTKYLPEFQKGRSEITIRDLMTHFSGMRPDLDLKPVWSGYETGVGLALTDKPMSPPRAQFVYSDINFILLGEIVRRVSGRTLPEYVRQVLLYPLGMRDTMFQPPAARRPRIAPTERIEKNGPPLRGVVHDETARYMGGVAGHAGLFSTADDLARFAEMMLGKGTRGGLRVFSPWTVEKFTTPQSPPDQPVLRGLGWDIDSPLSGNRGELFPIGSYGHTGFTGTSMWIDPSTQSYVILLSNSVHPYRRAAITSLRGRVATIAAAALGVSTPGVILTGYNEVASPIGKRRQVAHDAEVLTGLDVLEEQQFRPLLGKRVGLITNQTGVDRLGQRNLDRMLQAGVQVTALFSPEHGIGGIADTENIKHSKDPATGIPIWSLYSGKSRRPSSEMLRGLGALVFDIQDVGARFYTYISTMAYAMEEASKAGIPFYILDRPNPITGVHVEGPVLDRENISFVGYFPVALRHGMTVGELARMFNAENHIGAELTVIPCRNWERGDWFDATGLPWINPSPNLRNLNAALLYPGIALLEYSAKYSVGRGTDTPFEQIGAEFIDGPRFATYLNDRRLPGIRCYGTARGVRFLITNREILDSSRLGLEVAAALLKLYPGKVLISANQKLIGNDETIRRLEAGEDPTLILESQRDRLREFLELRQKYLLYP